MLLTIGMIVKNEEKYLERCLNGIKSILEQVDSELIIADTGSTDRTVEIAKKFTDNVFYFEWIKDFSAARNSTLEKAQGEWYMFVDADEIFESCDEIIHFFNSGEYKKYNSASYIIRNLLDFGNGERYSDFKGTRLIKILPETKFVNPIHECLTTSGQPLKVLNDIAIHYGYIHSKDTEAARKKFERNSEPLIQRYESGERTGLLYIQLYECFARHEPEKADEFLEEGVEFCKRRLANALPVLYAKKASTLYGDSKDYEGVLDVCKEYFNMPKVLHPTAIATDVDMVCAKGLSLFKLKRYDEAIECFIKFFALFKDYTNGKLRTNDDFLSSFAFARDDNFLSVLQNFIYACLQTNKLNLACDYLKRMPIAKYSIVSSVVYITVLQEMEIFERIGYSDIQKFYVRFEEKGREIFRNTIFKKLFRAPDPAPILSFFENEKECADLREPARLVYSIVNRRRAGDYKGCIAEMRQLVEGYPAMAGVISDYQKEVIREYEATRPMNEMQRLAAMIKSNIRNYIASGNTDAAAKTLAEYEKINPNDPDIGVLKGQIQ